MIGVGEEPGDRPMSAPLVLPSAGIQPEIAIAAIPDDERVWVPQAKDVWFRPLLLNTVTGGWCNLLRVRKHGVLHRHRHPMIVVGYVIKGKWRYLEHDWVATEDVFSKLEMCRRHYVEVGLGASYVDQFVR
jgi:hypothetical protein